MFRAAIPFLALAALAACDMYDPARISDYNGDSIRVQGTIFTPTEEVHAEARRICGRNGKVSEYASSKELPSRYVIGYEHLFLCMPPISSVAQVNAQVPQTAGGRIGGFRYD